MTVDICQLPPVPTMSRILRAVAAGSLLLSLPGCSEAGPILEDRSTAAHVRGRVTGPDGGGLGARTVRAEAVRLSVFGSDGTDSSGAYAMRLATLGGPIRSDVEVWVVPDSSSGLASDTVRRDSVRFTPAGGDTIRVDFRLQRPGNR